MELKQDDEYSDKEIVAVLSAYNLEGSIGEIVKRTLPYVNKVLVLADGSTDDTAQAAKAEGAIVPEPELVRGKGFAVIKGIEESKKFDPDIVLLMDADGQHLPEEIPILVEPILANRADMVVGSRMKGVLKTSLINKVGNFGLKLISFLVTFKWLSDTESGFRAFRAIRLYELRLTARGYEIEGELLLKALHRHFRVVEVPISVPIAVPGVTVFDGFKAGWYKLKTGIGLKFRKVPG